MRLQGFSIATLAATLLVGCGETARRAYRFDDPETVRALNEAWAARKSFAPLPPFDDFVPLYAQYLAGMRIVLDPGHGGDGDRPGYKRGPTNVREAEINLGVARFLRDYLQNGGAQVRMTRDADVDVGLAERAAMANDWPAHLFVSIHHNAAARVTANYASVWYHGAPDDCPSCLDLARHLALGIVDALRLPELSANPLKSDTLMYPEGFAVLRELRVTGCLTEGSFFTHPYEEYRLSQPAYQRREAFGLFLGLARYAWAGLPSSEWIEPASDACLPRGARQLRLRLRTGLERRSGWATDQPLIFWNEVHAKINGTSADIASVPERGEISVALPPDLPAGQHRLDLTFRNYNGNANPPGGLLFCVTE